jgi:hypothetical protein
LITAGAPALIVMHLADTTESLVAVLAVAASAKGLVRALGQRHNVIAQIQSAAAWVASVDLLHWRSRMARG